MFGNLYCNIVSIRSALCFKVNDFSKTLSYTNENQKKGDLIAVVITTVSIYFIMGRWVAAWLVVLM
jgi:hypothetical protein